jgi:hypothetical protein
MKSKTEQQELRIRLERAANEKREKEKQARKKTI